MNRYLFVIDYQNDFVDGALGFPGAEALDAGIAARVREYGPGRVIFVIGKNKIAENYDDAMKRIKTAIQETDTAIENLWQALEKGQGVDTIMERINKRQEEKAELEAQLAIEAKKERVISAQEVTHFLSVLQKSNFDDPLNRRAVINIFLNKIYLYDDKFRLVLNGSGQPVEIDNIMLDEIDDYFDSQISDSAECSSMVADAPPK